MKNSDTLEAEERANDLRRRFSTAELCELFVGREHDMLFSYVGETVTSPFHDPHIKVWNGWEQAISSRWAGVPIAPNDTDRNTGG